MNAVEVVDTHPPDTGGAASLTEEAGEPEAPAGGSENSSAVPGSTEAEAPPDPALFAHALRIAEALVFASDRPVTPARLAGALPPGCDARAVLTALSAACAGRPVQLVEVGGGFAFRTAPELAPAITRVVEVPRRLPRAAMETLAIVAYHQPVTRTEIEEIRGASLSQSTLELLLDAALIAPRGRKEVPGRPSLWGTTPRFLEQFGLKAMGDLPRREELVNEPTLPLQRAAAAGAAAGSRTAAGGSRGAAAGGMSLRVSGIRHAYGEREVLRGIDLETGPGEILCLLGPSGDGKTTLLRLVAGLEPLQAGRIELNGAVLAEPGREVPPEERRVGFVFQDYALFPHLTVAENVAFGLRRVPRGERGWQVAEALASVGLETYAGAYPHMLSGGQQQRVALARALAPRPQALLLDEAFASLDARLRDQVRDDTLHVLQTSGIPALVVTHDAEEAMFMADRIALMREGRVVQVGTPEELYLHPREPFVATFLGEVNRMPATVRGGRAETAIGSVPAAGLARRPGGAAAAPRGAGDPARPRRRAPRPRWWKPAVCSAPPPSCTWRCRTAPGGCGTCTPACRPAPCCRGGSRWAWPWTRPAPSCSRPCGPDSSSGAAWCGEHGQKARGNVLSAPLSPFIHSPTKYRISHCSKLVGVA